ncbi:hypothetical protein JTB14_014185 [Gonioctena quinquepunctata]|nr:hypothetical protein JTB14_014185 [Gonioctena quinquepunctata]
MMLPKTVGLLICLLLCSCVDESATLKEGDSCTLDDGSNGICRRITKCESAKEATKQGILPTACDFIGNIIIACCKEEIAFPQTNLEKTINPSLRAPPMMEKSHFHTPSSGRPIGSVSKQKCNEYAAYARVTEDPTLSFVSEPRSDLECAISSEPLIIGGREAALKEFPHMVAVGYQPNIDGEISWLCGGSLISANFVLTAAHCIHHLQLGAPKLIRVGITNLTDLSTMQERKVKQIIPHPLFVGRKYHDIALLKLTEDVDMNPGARPACLHTDQTIPNITVAATGWGVMSETGSSSNHLLKVGLEIFSQEVCNNSYRSIIIEVGSPLDKGIVDDWMICAGSTKKFRDACRGDSGGPLQFVHEKTQIIECMYDIIGVTSFGKACGLAINQPGVYTRVSNYVQWIEDTVWPLQ